MKNRTKTAKDACALDPWAFPSPRQAYDARKLVRGFETIDVAKAERDLHARGAVRLGRLPHLRPAPPLVVHRGGLGNPR